MEPGLRAATDALLNGVDAKPGARLLDVACGPGYSTASARARGADVLGIDLSPAMIRAARRRFPNVPFVVGDMLHPPAGPWDAVTCRFAAHHVDAAWLDAAWRVLRPGGRIAIAEVVPSPGADDERNSGKLPVAEWRRRFEDAGFLEVVAEQCEIQIPPLGLSVERHPWPETWIIRGQKPTRRWEEREAQHAD